MIMDKVPTCTDPVYDCQDAPQQPPCVLSVQPQSALLLFTKWRFQVWVYFGSGHTGKQTAGELHHDGPSPLCSFVCLYSPSSSGDRSPFHSKISWNVFPASCPDSWWIWIPSLSLFVGKPGARRVCGPVSGHWDNMMLVFSCRLMVEHCSHHPAPWWTSFLQNKHRTVVHVILRSCHMTCT